MNGYWPRWQDTKIQNVLQCTPKGKSVTGKRTVERVFTALHIHTFLKLNFCQIKRLEAEKAFW